MSTRKPNIILITSDQQRADCNGFENPDLKTPHLDWLARDGTRFNAESGVPAFACFNADGAAAADAWRMGQRR